MFPKQRAARIGHFHSPAAAHLKRLSHQPLHSCGIIAGQRRQHGRVVGCQQEDPLVENGKLGQFAVGQSCGAGGDGGVENGGIAQAGVEGAGGVDRGHSSGALAGQLRSDAPPRIHLRPGDVAVQIDPSRHHHQPTGIDLFPAAALGLWGRGHDASSLDPEISNHTISAMGGVVESAAAQHPGGLGC